MVMALNMLMTLVVLMLMMLTTLVVLMLVRLMVLMLMMVQALPGWFGVDDLLSMMPLPYSARFGIALVPGSSCPPC